MLIKKFHNKQFYLSLIFFSLVIISTWITFITSIIVYGGDFSTIILIVVIGIIITAFLLFMAFIYSIFSPSLVLIKDDEILFLSLINEYYSSKFQINKINKIIIRPKGTGKHLKIITDESNYGYHNEFKIISTPILDYIEKMAKERGIEVIRYKWGEWP